MHRFNNNYFTRTFVRLTRTRANDKPSHDRVPVPTTCTVVQKKRPSYESRFDHSVHCLFGFLTGGVTERDHREQQYDEAGDQSGDRMLRETSHDISDHRGNCRGQRVRDLRRYMVDVQALCAGTRHDGGIGDR